jgi:Reverse transcriptase (RNA-dependent DNA polymerase)
MLLDPSSTEWRIRETINRISVENDELEITPEEWRNKFKHWKASTSTSPSGVHLGHYKALLETMYVPNDTQLVMDIEIFKKKQDIFNIHLRFINSVLTHGRSITRWRQCNNICIPKKPGCIDIDKYRNIHIYECDLNAIKWKNAIHKAAEEEVICERQFGSRKAKTSQLPILIEILQQDYSRITRICYGQINYNAKACYDRILPTLASLVSESFGVHQTILNLHRDLLQHMEYYVAMQQDWKYFDTMSNPIYGTGQGSGNSPHIWTMVSSILLQILNAEAKGASYPMQNGTDRNSICG